MLVRFQVWRARRRAKYLSKFSYATVDALVNGVWVGEFINGRSSNNDKRR